MAKKTKDSNLSLEEKLEQALIPNWDEPYKLPDNWCWVNLGTICSLENGVKQSGEELVYLDAKTLREINEPQFRDNGVVVVQNQKVILVDGENSGEVFIVPYRGYMGSTFRIINISKNSDEMYVRYFIDFNRDKLRKNKVGSAIPHLNKELFFSLKFPFPPLSEQQRIVARIESLFAKLDEAKEKAQEVVDGFEARKAAILHKAFSGELTQKWREENGVSFDKWDNKLFDKCIEKMQNGLAKRTGSTGIPYIVLRLANLSDDGFITDDLREIVLDEKEQKSYKLNIGDVVMIRVNGSKDNVAKQILVSENNLWAFCDHIIRIRYNESVLPEYMVLYSKSEAYKIYVKDNIVSSAGQNTISRKGMARLSIPVPSIEEQKEIIDILSNMFDKERRVKETAETVINQIDTMKKAILARAFRGELGTNDPREENAVELVKEILAGTNEEPQKKSKRIRVVIPKEIDSLLKIDLERKIIRLFLKSDTGEITAEEIMALSSKKIDLIDSIYSLKEKKLIEQLKNGLFILLR